MLSTFAFTDAHWDEISQRGWTQHPQAVDHSICRKLLSLAQDRYEVGRFRPARIGAGSRSTNDLSVRGDEILWLQSGAQHDDQILQALADLRKTLNEQLRIGLCREEFHWARYPVGTGYQRHLDCPPTRSLSSGDSGSLPSAAGRRVSCLLYLNPDWKQEWGGHLEIESPDQKTSHQIMPKIGQMVIFRSDLVWHQVRPSLYPRWSLCGWFRDDQSRSS